ncbi:putative base plate wedget subunit protein [Pseudomonas phage Lu11]|uniref:putative base plate wedget subunit protein n=1 Tax=Pseudomonas phage Lu11 TaxID=1161927 RepID=UPI00025F180E|nr:putative base plate wedget subunit protein [Pseudomonas phage Lu11]AFH14763.1 putative base plate wedget subunit protein [Pseudomonas phage Lu11]
MTDRFDFPTSITDIDEAVGFFREKLKETGTWDDMLPTNVGAFITRIFGGMSVSHQHSILMGARNAYFKTANRDSSVYALTRGQGVFIERRNGASATVRMRNGANSAVFVAPYRQHFVDKVPFYNPQQYYVIAGETQDVILTQGLVKTKTFDLDTITNLQLHEFLLDEPGFNVSNDLYVYTTDKNTGNTQLWEATDRGMFEHTADDRVYYHMTTANGDASLVFGTGEYGARLPARATMTVRYVVNEGTRHNSMLPGVRSVYSENPLIQGETLETTAGGADPKEASFYRQYSPVLYRSRDKWISQEEIKAGVRSYPGVADCAVLGQRDIAPDDKTWMNTIRICVLPVNTDTWGGGDINPKSASWQQFLKWLMPHLHGSIEVQTWNPTKVFIKVHVAVALFEWAANDSDKIKQTINENILKLFRKRPDILNRRVSRSDIEKACRVNGVDYIEVLSPLERSIVLNDPTSYCVLAETPLIDITLSERVDE